MSTPDPEVIADRLTRERLRSYLAATSGDIADALALYDWNTAIAGALHEDIGRVEIITRNALDHALTDYGQRQAWPTPWYQRQALFAGRHGQQALKDIATARDRATRRGRTAEVHGKVIAELTFGFWRYLCTAPYLTSLWVPTLTAAFPNHPAAGDPRCVRSDVDDRMQRVHFLRNRVAHHEPIHNRDLLRDRTGMAELVGWIDNDCATWADTASRIDAVLQTRP